MSRSDVEDSLGFDVVSVVHVAKRVSGTNQRVRLMFDQSSDSAQAHSYHDEAGVCVIKLPRREIIKAKRGLDDLGVRGKYKAAICEEVAHCSEHETMHNDAVVRKTLACMIEALTPEELAHPYIQEKKRRLERSPERVEPTPIRVGG